MLLSHLILMENIHENQVGGVLYKYEPEVGEKQAIF